MDVLGCFAGDQKGPYIFWEKDWGKISGKTYRERTVPVLAQYLSDLRGLNGEENEMIIMQDMRQAVLQKRQ